MVLPDGLKAKSKVKALSSHFDLPACIGVLEQVTYVVHDSYHYFDEHGETVKTGPRPCDVISIQKHSIRIY